MNSTPKPIRVYGKDLHDNPGRMMMLAYVVDKCGYKCDYCYNIRPRTGAVMDLGALEKLTRQLVENHGREVLLDLIGGEVTEHPGLFEFAKIRHPAITVAIYSNFSKDISLYRQLIQAGYTLILTYHPHVDPDVFLDKFAGFDISDYDKIVAMSVMYRPGFSERALYVFDQMHVRFPQFKSMDLSLLDANEYFPNVRYSKQEMMDFNRLSSRFGIGNTVVEYDDGSS